VQKLQYQMVRKPMLLMIPMLRKQHVHNCTKLQCNRITPIIVSGRTKTRLQDAYHVN